jgi:short-subunit dehydrogenase
MSKYLATKKCELILVARNKEKLEELQEKLSTKVTIIVADLSNEQKVKELYVLTKKENIDILINNAGFGTTGSFTETDYITELNMISTNICAVHTLTKLYLHEMKKKNSGYILNVASIAGFMPGPQMATYHASKAYVLNLTQSIYEELNQEGYDINISALCPGPIKTPFIEKANVKFKTKLMTAEYVAKYAIDKMFEGKYMIIPGGNNKIIRILSKIVPDKLIGKIVYKMEQKK